jgi:hypothetical protein
MEYLEHIIAREEAERERKYREDIGTIGMLFDNELYFCLVFVVINLLGFLIGFGVGSLL